MKVSIAIPDSALSDEITQKEKSSKISQIARACAIFQIDEIFIYHEILGEKSDAQLMSTILKYLETPQYFRRYLYPKMDLLKYSGILYPLKIPSHNQISDPKKIKTNDIREGLIVSVKGKKFLDVGIKTLIPYFGKEQPGSRVSILFKSGYPNFAIKEISKDQIKEYWGYKVKERGNLFSLLSSWNGQIILTSRKGKVITQEVAKGIVESSKPLLLVFGSPERGIHEILGGTINQLQNSKILNFFPNQATETVRLEEAIIGSLSILNLFRTSY
jgi:predicted SPOUT superfamily RNA methylase MTH1